MNLFDRFILTLYSLALIVLSVVFIGVLCRFIPASYVQMFTDQMLGGGINIPYLVVALIFLLISVRFFFSAFQSNKSDSTKSIYQRTDLGIVNISLDTIRSIAERAAKKVKGVKDLRTVVRTKESGNHIILRITVDGETPIPEMTSHLQTDVKAQVEAICGIDVAEVAVVVEEVVSAEYKAVRTRRLE